MAAPVTLALCCCTMLCVFTGLSADSAASYTPPTLNTSYASSSDFNPRGLQPLYSAVTSFVRGIQNKDPLPPGLVVVKDGAVTTDGGLDLATLVSYYGGVVAVVVCGLLAALLVLFVALARCVCCCCGGASSRRASRRRPGKGAHLFGQDADDDAEMARKRGGGAPWLTPTALAATTCAVMVFAVVAFTTNAYVASGIEGLGSHVQVGVRDLNLYIDNANTEVNTILEVNYGELSGVLENVLEGCRVRTISMVATVRSSLPLDMLIDMSAGIEKVFTGLNAVQTEIQSLVTTGNDLVDGIKNVRNNLNSICTSNCPPELRTFIDDLFEPSFPEMPSDDVSSGIASIKDLVDSDLNEKLAQGRRQIETLSQTVADSMDQVITTINEAVTQTGTTLRTRASELLDQVSSASASLRDVDDQVQKFQTEFINPNGIYRNIAFVVLSVILLAVALLTTMGLVWGCCSSRHSYRILSFPVWLIVTTFSVLIIVVTVLFLAGLVADRACQGLRDPEGNQLIGIVDQLVKQRADEKAPAFPGVSSVITECHKNKPLYEVLDLDSTIDIDQVLRYVDQFSFDSYLSQIKTATDSMTAVVLLDSTTERQLADLAASDLTRFDFAEFKMKVATAQDTLNEVDAAAKKKELEDIAQASGYPLASEISVLQKLADDAASMERILSSLMTDISQLEVDSKLGYPSLSDAIQMLLGKVESAKDIIGKAGPDFFQLSSSTATQFLDEVRGYLGFVVSRVRTNALPCGPLSDIYNAMVSGTCDEIVAPWNGFWASVGCCLLLFIPTAILASCLSSRHA